MSGVLWPIVLAVPLLGYLFLYRWPETTPRWLWLCCLPALLAAGYPPPAMEISLWPGAHWGVDAMRRGFLAFSALVWLAATLYAGRDRPRLAYGKWFWLAWLTTFTGNLLLVISLDAAGFYVGYSIMSLSAYILIAHGGNKVQRRGSRIYLQLAVLSELLVFTGLIFRLEESGLAFDLIQWQQTPAAPLTALLLLAGFGIKLGVWPLHFWMPMAYPASRPVVGAILSGAMMKTALLGLWFFLPGENPLSGWTDWLLVVAIVSAIYGVLAGLAQKDPRKILAYSSISQAGYLLTILILAWHQPESRGQWGLLLLMWAAHHGLAKGALFLGTGIAAARRLQALQWFLLAIPALALAGLPFTSGVVVKTALEEGLKETLFEPFSTMLLVGSLATGLLMLRALWRIYRSQPAGREAKQDSGATIAWLALSLMALLLPWFWPAMTEPFHQSWKVGKLLSSGGVILLAAAIAALVIQFPIVIQRPFNRRPIVRASYLLKPLLFNLSLPIPSMSPNRQWWRQCERRWNRFWQRNTVSFTAFTLGLLLLAAGAWWA